MIMGSGKTSSAISWMNDHKDEKFIYISPYLDQAKRIREACPELEFVEPYRKTGGCGFSKMSHMGELIEDGRNIASTHAAFRRISKDMLKNIRKNEYTLIVDEAVDLMEVFEIHADDFSVLVDAGFLVKKNGIYEYSEKKYEGEAITPLIEKIKDGRFLNIGTDSDGSSVVRMLIPPDLITAFKNACFLTYMASGQEFFHILKICGVQYKFIGTRKGDDGRYEFCKSPGETPKYVLSLRSKIHIESGERINVVGKHKYSLSHGWFKKNRDGVVQLRKNLVNYFNNIKKDIPCEKRMWSTFKDYEGAVAGKGYKNCFVPFNIRATNDYSNKTCLAYCLDVYMNVGVRLYLRGIGGIVDDDTYALSCMVQWIWRSAIRNGEDIWIYIPSKRMRTLLLSWIDSLDGGVSDV